MRVSTIASTTVTSYRAGMHGSKVFSAWLRANGVSQLEAARVLLVSPSSVSLWLSKRRAPSAAGRVAIERWTSGAVAASSWLSREEAALEAELGRVEPWRKRDGA